jgi:ThiS family
MQTMQAPATETTKVIYGVNELDLDLAGKTVHGIWKALEQVFNIPRDAAVTVNGSQVGDDYVVRPGDEIEFQKQAGVKGLAA